MNRKLKRLSTNKKRKILLVLAKKQKEDISLYQKVLNMSDEEIENAFLDILEYHTKKGGASYVRN